MRYVKAITSSPTCQYVAGNTTHPPLQQLPPPPPSTASKMSAVAMQRATGASARLSAPRRCFTRGAVVVRAEPQQQPGAAAPAPAELPAAQAAAAPMPAAPAPVAAPAPTFRQ
jgi:hypothetical protein